MLCKKPYMLGVLPCGCGQCMPCRINRRRLWASRMLLESVKHAGSCFVTLTYSDENVPKDMSLKPKDPQDWLKRLRRRIAPVKVRFFLVGEYGDNTQRPHYHCALFGIDQLFGGGTDGCRGVVQDTWGLGHTFVGELTKDSAGYVAGYVTKKMTRVDDERLQGRHPEFARMSLRPGIGAPAMVDVGSSVGTEFGLEDVSISGDVPRVLNFGKKKIPLGRYLRRRLRYEVGFATMDTPEKAKDKFGAKMRVLLQADVFNSENKAKPLGKILVDKMEQKVRNLEVRTNIYSKKGSL